jgi:hypothetical protein
MATDDTTSIKIERAMEQLRQEREVFDQSKKHESMWFGLRLVMGYSSVVLLFAVIIICSWILYNSPSFPEFTVKAAGAAIFVDVLGLLVSVWKVVLNPDSVAKLKPVTQEEI